MYGDLGPEEGHCTFPPRLLLFPSPSSFSSPCFSLFLVFSSRPQLTTELSASLSPSVAGGQSSNMQAGHAEGLAAGSPQQQAANPHELTGEPGVGAAEHKAAVAASLAAIEKEKSATAVNTADESTLASPYENDGDNRTHRRPTLTVAELPKRVLECQYAVRGPTVALARELSLQLSSEDNKLPFKKLIYVNIGDPQALGQPPISFYRQSGVTTDNSELLQNDS
ncbi:hypothetical protein Efla_006081 [Eimeria flavescens]